MLSSRIRELRLKNKLKKQDLANQIGVSGATISMWENGQRRPDIEKLQDIAKYFNVTVDWLLNASDSSIEIKLPKTENTVTILGRNGTLKTFIVDDSQIKTMESFIQNLANPGVDDNNR